MNKRFVLVLFFAGIAADERKPSDIRYEGDIQVTSYSIKDELGNDINMEVKVVPGVGTRSALRRHPSVLLLPLFNKGRLVESSKPKKIQLCESSEYLEFVSDDFPAEVGSAKQQGKREVGTFENDDFRALIDVASLNQLEEIYRSLLTIAQFNGVQQERLLVDGIQKMSAFKSDIKKLKANLVEVAAVVSDGEGVNKIEVISPNLLIVKLTSHAGKECLTTLAILTLLKPFIEKFFENQLTSATIINNHVSSVEDDEDQSSCVVM